MRLGFGILKRPVCVPRTAWEISPTCYSKLIGWVTPPEGKCFLEGAGWAWCMAGHPQRCRAAEIEGRLPGESHPAAGTGAGGGLALAAGCEVTSLWPVLLGLGRWQGKVTAARSLGVLSLTFCKGRLLGTATGFGVGTGGWMSTAGVLKLSSTSA